MDLKYISADGPKKSWGIIVDGVMFKEALSFEELVEEMKKLYQQEDDIWKYCPSKICLYCGKSLYQLNPTKLVTGCPSCHKSYVD